MNRWAISESPYRGKKLKQGVNGRLGNHFQWKAMEKDNPVK